jgi:hypothetical protein
MIFANLVEKHKTRESISAPTMEIFVLKLEDFFLWIGLELAPNYSYNSIKIIKGSNFGFTARETLSNKRALRFS